MKWSDYWYIVAESSELPAGKVLPRKILGEWLAVFRDERGTARVLQDRCLHRNARLSAGRVKGGKLLCSYHGWTYSGAGEVVAIPSEGPSAPARKRCAARYPVIEQDGFVYTRLSGEKDIKPFPMPCHGKLGYTTIRLQNLFKNTVTNCAENFVDIPHTTFVHPHIFRNPGHERICATVERRRNSVKVTYRGEKANLGIFSWFLNPSGQEIRHTDEFFSPNITTVNYWFSEHKHFIITSQSVPVDDHETLVYTDLTYNYGIWNRVSRPIVRKQGQAIIDQDVEILGNQGETIRKYGAQFQNSPADIIHTFIESLQREIEDDRDPEALPNKKTEIEFWI